MHKLREHEPLSKMMPIVRFLNASAVLDVLDEEDLIKPSSKTSDKTIFISSSRNDAGEVFDYLIAIMGFVWKTEESTRVNTSYGYAFGDTLYGYSLGRIFDIWKREKTGIMAVNDVSVVSIIPDKGLYDDSRTLIDLLESEPFEVGVPHPSEEFISDYIKANLIVASEKFFSHLFWKLFNNPSALYNLIRVLGRQDFDLIKPWIYTILERSLQHPDLEVRTAGIYTLDKIGDSKSIQILRNHKETFPWLEDFINEAVSDYDNEGGTIGE